VLKGIEGKAMEIEAVVAPGTSSLVELNLFRSPDGKETTSVRLYRNGEPYNRHGGERWTVSIDTSRSSLDPTVSHRFPSNVEFLRFDKEPLRIRLFIDMSIVEVFVDGQASLAERVYPTRPDSNGVSVRANGDGTTVELFNAWQMRGIY
jgi:beta-fructofuranosidase